MYSDSIYAGKVVKRSKNVHGLKVMKNRRVSTGRPFIRVAGEVFVGSM